MCCRRGTNRISGRTAINRRRSAVYAALRHHGLVQEAEPANENDRRTPPRLAPVATDCVGTAGTRNAATASAPGMGPQPV